MIVQHSRRAVWETRSVMLSLFAAMNVVLSPELGVWMAAPALAVIPLIARNRVTTFEMALPVHARTVVLARLLWTFVLLLVPWIAWLVSLQARGPSKWPVSTALEALAIAALAVMLPSLIRARELRSPPIWLVLLQWGAIAGASALLIRLLPAAAAVAALMLAVLLAFVATWRSMPESFVASAPMQHAQAEPVRSHAVRRNEDAAVFPWRMFLRESCAPFILFSWVITFMMGTAGGSGGSSLVIVFTTFTSGIEQLRRRTWWMYGLPFSNRQRLVVMLIPAMLMPVALFSVGALVGLPGVLDGRNAMGVGAPFTSTEAQYYSSPTRVPLAYWPVASDAAPVITAPWGESTPAYTLHIPGVTYYNPYSARETNSPRFVAWQFARATTAVYGHPIPQSVYEANTERLPGRTLSASWRMKILNAGALLLFALLLMLPGEAMRSNRLARLPYLPTVAPFLAILPLTSAMLVDMVYGAKQGTGVILPRVQAALLALSAALPPNLLAVIAVVAAAVGAAYWLLEWQFGRTEGMDPRLLAPRARS